MRVTWMLAAAAAAMIGGCSKSASDSQSTSATMDAAAPDTAAASRAKEPGADGAAPLEVKLPQLAYAYKLGFRLPSDRIAHAQEAHRGLCEKLGPARCQLLALERGSADGSQGDATLRLRVASAKGFSESVAKVVADAGGRASDTNVAAEDVSKQMVDAEARIRQRELLVARLTEILRNRTGKVAELVEAERSVAEAQEELDKAKAWLAELRGRVAMSDFEIRYSAVAPSVSPGSTGAQLSEAVSGSGASFVIGLRALLTLAIYLLPWALLLVPVVLVVRRLRRKRDGGAANADQA
jgi:hypothetical protein